MPDDRFLTRAAAWAARRVFPPSPRRKFIGLEFKSKIRVPMRERQTRVARWMPRGFLSETSYIYDFDKYPYTDYLSDYQRMLAFGVNEWAADLLVNKLAFQRLVEPMLPMPALLGILRSGRLHPLDGPPGDPDRVFEMLDESEHGLVLKPLSGSCGRGVLVLGKDTERIILNSKPATAGDVLAQIPRDEAYMITPFVSQSAYSRAFYPHTTNTIRILTMIDPAAGRAFVATAVQRMGCERSRPVDNWTQGGLSALVDIETGRLGRGVTFPTNGKLIWHNSHPESGAAIEGAVVPGWAGIRDRILDAADRLAFIPYVGWDVIVMDDGFCVLEGNRNSDVNLLQAHRPLLIDPRVRAFFERFGVIRCIASVPR